MKIIHSDVFTNTPFSGNGLTVIFPEKELSSQEMQQMACEFRQFETIFLWQEKDGSFIAKIFTMQEELDFAGHPILGAAAVVHDTFFPLEPQKTISFRLNCKSVITQSQKADGYFQVSMNQGVPEFRTEVDAQWQRRYCQALNISVADLADGYEMEVISTGLPYLLVPLKSGLEKARIIPDDFEDLLSQNQAKFVYLFDMNAMEGRTWDNISRQEDVATGSAAGPTGAYLYKHGCIPKTCDISIHQGRFLGRPSVIKVSCDEATGEIYVAGSVAILVKGEM